MSAIPEDRARRNGVNKSGKPPIFSVAEVSLPSVAFLTAEALAKEVAKDGHRLPAEAFPQQASAFPGTVALLR